MKIKKKLCLLILFLLLLLLSNIRTYANESSFECGTDSELTRELYGGLIEKKLTELNQQYTPWSNEISLFSIHFAVLGKNYMPSTGDVKILTVPIEFKDEKFNKDMSVHLQKVFF